MIRVFEKDGVYQMIAVADLLKNAGEVIQEAVAMLTSKTTVVYSDPPWNPGNEKWWRRHAEASIPESYDHLLDAWCKCAAVCEPEHVFCEQSVNDKHRALFTAAVDRCEDWTLPLIEEWTVHYGSPGARSCIRPNKLLHFGNSKISTDPSGMRGQPMTHCVVDGISHDVPWLLIDPCMGKGMTSREAHLHGAHCVGTELNAKRAGFAIKWLLKRGYVEVYRVSC